MSFSAFWDRSVLNHIFGKSSYTAPSNIYVGLSSTTPASDGSNVTEPSNGYARVSSAHSDWNTSTGTGGASLSSASVFTFPAATADWAASTYFVLYDASTSGNLLAFGQLATPVTVLNTEIASFAAGSVLVSLA